MDNQHMHLAMRSYFSTESTLRNRTASKNGLRIPTTSNHFKTGKNHERKLQQVARPFRDLKAKLLMWIEVFRPRGKLRCTLQAIFTFKLGYTIFLNFASDTRVCKNNITNCTYRAINCLAETLTGYSSTQ